MNKEEIAGRFSLLDPAVQHCPYEFYRHLRKEAPVYWAGDIKCFIVSTYELAKQVFEDTATFSSRGVNRRIVNESAAEHIKALRASGYPPVPFLATNDPPTHTVYRQLSSKIFTPKRIFGMRKNVEPIVTELFDPFVAKGGGDFMREFAIPLPIMTVADFLGIPRDPAMVAKYRLWSDATIGPLNGVISPEQEIAFAEDILEYQAFFVDEINERIKRPRDDLITEMINAEVPGENRRMDMAELLSSIQQWLVAGGETTTYTLGSGMLLLAEQPELLEGLRQGEEQVRTFAEETLRTRSPSQGLLRQVLKDTVLDGVRMPAGSMVSVRIGSANRDERVFANAEEVDLCRGNAKSHLSFGVGIHFCMGAPLARMELFSAFQRFANSGLRIELDEAAGGYSYVPSLFFLALKQLHIRLS
jgi:cytochrome P450